MLSGRPGFWVHQADPIDKLVEALASLEPLLGQGLKTGKMFNLLRSFYEKIF